MFLFKRPVTAVLAGMITAFIGVALDAAFTMSWAAQHANAVL